MLESLRPLPESLLPNQVVGIRHDSLLSPRIYQGLRLHDKLRHLPRPANLGDGDVKVYHLFRADHSVSDLPAEDVTQDIGSLRAAQ